jgi:hypothetical protein
MAPSAVNWLLPLVVRVGGDAAGFSVITAAIAG